MAGQSLLTGSHWEPPHHLAGAGPDDFYSRVVVGVKWGIGSQAASNSHKGPKGWSIWRVRHTSSIFLLRFCTGTIWVDSPES